MYKGKLIAADYELGTIEFAIEEDFTAIPGEYMIIPKEKFEKLKTK